MDLGRRLDQVLQVRAREEVAEVDEFAVVFVLDCGIRGLTRLVLSYRGYTIRLFLL